MELFCEDGKNIIIIIYFVSKTVYTLFYLFTDEV